VPGPKRVPTHLKLLRGNPGHQKLNKDEPQPTQSTELPEPPPFLSGYAKDEWWRLVAELRAFGLLTVLDIMPFAAYCQAYGHWRTAEEALMKMAERDSVTGGLLIKGALGDPRANPLIRIANNAAADMIRFGGEFGMGPAARARIRAGVAWREDGGKFDGLLA
jgi:P27 family predicted phage terminase small subunit